MEFLYQHMSYAWTRRGSCKVILLLFHLMHAGVYACSPAESAGLLSLKPNDTSKTFESWKPGTDCCSGWKGVTCDKNTRNVIGVNLTGDPWTLNSPRLSADICLLTHLHIFSIGNPEAAFGDESQMEISREISFPYFTGEVPACIWNTTSLEYFDIGGLSLKAPLSSSICNLKKLKHLNMKGNEVVGDLPSCLWNMTELLYLDVGIAFEALSGEVSSQLCQLKNLQHLNLQRPLYLDSGILIGYIPACLWNMTELRYLNMAEVNLPGGFPSRVCNLKKLQHLSLKGNQLVGYVPPCIWNLTELEYLDLSFNGDIRGLLPASWDFANDRLRRVDLAHMSISGPLPEFFGNFSHLEYLDVSANMITALPTSLGRFAFPLKFLYAQYNQVGKIPPTVGNLWNLTELMLGSNEIQEVPASLGKLGNLIRLDLSFNAIGETPSLVSNLSTLENLSLDGNKINVISVSFDGLKSLFDLSLSRNAIKKVPASFGNLSNLYFLDLGDNAISEIPVSFGNVSYLTFLSLRNNSLTMSDVRPLLVGLSSLIFLDLSYNYLTNLRLNFRSRGIRNYSRPSTLDLSGNNAAGNIRSPASRLRYLHVAGNQLQGPIPVQEILAQWPLLSELDLSSNNFSGEIPEALDALNLTSLKVSGNRLSGDLPQFVYNSSSLHELYASGNRLSGHVSEFLWSKNTADGGRLDLSSNQFEGPLPSFAESMFSFLVLSGNAFTGAIPVGLARSISLQILDISFNHLSGKIPEILGNLSTLQMLNLGSNELTGGLPSGLGNCSSLLRLHVENNFLTGKVQGIGIGDGLWSLSMRNNNFEGQIPPSLSKCSQLQVLDLSDNWFSGTLPSTLRNLSSSLRVFLVGTNHLTGEFPSWIVDDNFTSLQLLDLSNNAFWGELPTSYSSLHGFLFGSSLNSNVTLYEDEIVIEAKGGVLSLTQIISAKTSFDVSYNRFSGSIPKRLGELRALRWLTLSGNNFSGSIPASLAKLTVLESLNLQDNSLTGHIPTELALISGLEYFNVANNRLTGPIPTGGQFNTFTNTSDFENNLGLCGFPLQKCFAAVTPATAPTKKCRSFKCTIADWVSLPGFLIGFAFSFAALLVTFALSRTARSCLFGPRSKAKVVYPYRRPYGVYVPPP